MDTLNLTYTEVTERIPYRQLVVMQKDKLRPCYGDKRVEVTEAEFNIKYDEIR